MEGHNKPCYYCGENCDALAGNPGKWPVMLCHKDEPGVMKYHHVECVTKRLIENVSNETLIRELMRRYHKDESSFIDEFMTIKKDTGEI